MSDKWIRGFEKKPMCDGYYLFCNKGCLPFVGFYSKEKGLYVGDEPAGAEFWMELPESPKA